jgi:hypothetical protein
MGKNTKVIVESSENRESRPAVSPVLQLRAMPQEKAKELIWKISKEHKGLFRRLAK